MAKQADDQPETASFKIDRGVPIPNQKSRGRDTPWPFQHMKVGDSLFEPGEVGERLRIAAYGRHSRHNGEHYLSRTVTEDGVEGVRVWRMK